MIGIRETMLNLRAKKEKCFIAYITAGDPNLESTFSYVAALSRGGADIIELGVPFSDPMADGPTNQRSAQRALQAKTNLSGIFQLVTRLRQEKITTPIVLFSYFNPIFKRGIEKFAQQAKESQVNGVLIVDLPPERAHQEKKIFDKYGIETIFLASPTTDVKRLKTIEENSSGFVYYIARKGITGVQQDISETLFDEIQQVKKVVQGPMAVGFGISTAEQAYEISRYADAVIIGSRIVNIIEESDNCQTGCQELLEFSKNIKEAINRP